MYVDWIGLFYVIVAMKSCSNHKISWYMLHVVVFTSFIYHIVSVGFIAAEMCNKDSKCFCFIKLEWR